MNSFNKIPEMKGKDTEVFFSIIMPTFNRGHLIESAIRSVINQVYQSWELIIVDNASEDNTCGVIRDFSKTEKRIKYFYIPEKGVSKARNFGIQKAKGDFVCFLDDDDLYLPNFLLKLNEGILKHNSKKGFYRSFAILKNFNGNEHKQEIIFNSSAENNVQYLLTNMITPNCVCVSRKILDDYFFDSSLIVAEDCHLWLRIASEYPVICVPSHTSVYNIGSQTASTGSIQTYKRYIKSYQYIFNDKSVGKFLDKETMNRVLAKQYFWLMTEYGKERKLFKLVESYFMFVGLSKSLKEMRTFLSVLKDSLRQRKS